MVYSMTDFKIIESDWTKEFYSIYENVKQDILNGVKVKDIKVKYEISNGGWGSYRKELIKDGILKSTKQKQKESKYYTYYRNRFHVQKVINMKKYHIGTFKTEAQAKLCVRLMQDCDWDVNHIEQVKAQVWGAEWNSKKS